MDVSSEMIHSLLPVFLVTVLGTSTLAVGMIEGLSEGAALVTRTFSGPLSDRLGRRKTLALAGYGLGALTKPLFALATGSGLVLTARFLDRVGKGLRGAPRDALVADVTPPASRGAAYGLRQSLDTVGAFLGPLLAAGLMAATGGRFRTVFWIAVIPGALAVAILALGVREPRRASPAGPLTSLRWGALKSLGAEFAKVMAVGLVFTAARFSEAFLLLRAQSVGLAAAAIPLLLVAMNLVYSLTAYPAGRLSDRFGRRGLLILGLAVLAAANLVLAQAAAAGAVLLGIALWGLHLGLTQGILAALVADAAPPPLRGTAFGLFNLAGGIGLLGASLLAGGLWDRFGPPSTFLAGAGLASAAMVGAACLSRRQGTA
jgi:MFS family permease